MSIERYQPTSLLQQFNNEINRMFMRDGDGFPALATGQWSPAVDVRETDDAYFIEAEVPGVDPKAIEITLEKGVLMLAGERQHKVEAPEGDNAEGKQPVRYRERSYGRFVRRFSLPETADEDNIQARADNGVLHLTIAKKPQSQPRRIEVQG